MPREVGRLRDLGVLLVFLALVGVAMYANREPASGSHPALAQELLAMERADQRARNAQIELGVSAVGEEPSDEQKRVIDQMIRTDERNTKRLEEIVDRYGWPGRSLVGVKAAHAAWLLVQHADRDPMFQRRALDLMTAASSTEVAPDEIAYLTDRVLVAEGREQLYGTQFTCRAGRHTPRPISYPANVDARRARAGLDSLADATRRQLEVYGPCPDRTTEQSGENT